jgi:hypothetical protein
MTIIILSTKGVKAIVYVYFLGGFSFAKMNRNKTEKASSHL